MAAHQAPLSLGFSRQEHWSGLPFPSPMHENEKWKWSRSVVSDSSRPHGLQPTRLLCPWDFPGRSTGVGCHCLLNSVGCQQKWTKYILLHILLKNISHKNKHCCLLINISRLINLITCHGDSLILSDNCASISSAISSIYLVIMLTKRATCATFWTAASQSSR